jgi:phosphomannomutase
MSVCVHRTPIGEANVIAKMVETGAVVGGEGNGGVIYPPVHPGRDAATGIAMILCAMASRNLTLAELNAEVPDYVMVKKKYSIAGMSPDALLERMKQEFGDASRLVLKDGVKAVFKGAWVHARPSGTEPVVRVFAEAEGQEQVNGLLQRVRDKVLPRTGETDRSG